MDHAKLSAIKDLMEELIGEMEPDAEEFDVRLGKPKIDVLKVEGEMPLKEEEGMEMAEEMMGKDLDGDMEEGEDPEHQMAVFGDESPEEKLKKRIMKLRG